MSSNNSKIQFTKEFPFTCEGVLEILEEMLQFNPDFRSNARHLINNKVFDSIRQPEQEEDAPYQIQLEIDGADSFDYDIQASTKYELADYKKMLIEEISIIKNMKSFDSISEQI